MSEANDVGHLAGHPLSDVTMALRQFVAAADAEVARCRAELDAHKSRVVRARDLLAAAEAEAKRLHKSLDALEGGLPGRVGRPRGSSDPEGTRARLTALLPERPEWRPSELRAALAEQGHEVGPSSVTAALDALRRDGTAWKIGDGRWTAQPTEPEVASA